MEFIHIVWNFISTNFHIVGWSGLIFTVMKLSWKVSKSVNSFIDNIEDILDRQKKLENTVELLTTNHLPHIQAAIEESNHKTDDLLEEIRGMRRDVIQFIVSRK